MLKINNFLILLNKMSSCGIKALAYSRFMFLLISLKKELKKNNKDIFFLIFEMLEFYVQIQRKKVGGNVYQIPLFLKENFRFKKGVSSLLQVVDGRKEFKFFDRMFYELLDLYLRKGATLNLRNSLYLIASEHKSNLRFVKPKVKKLPINFKKAKF